MCGRTRTPLDCTRYSVLGGRPLLCWMAVEISKEACEKWSYHYLKFDVSEIFVKTPSHKPSKLLIKSTMILQMGRGISMNKNNISYVSVRYTKKDYQKLRLTLNSDDITLEKAIKIFIDRIEGRFFEQIRTLSNDYNQNGFSIMALACLLIETFAQFIKGLDDTRGVSRQEYIDFLMNSLDCFPTKAAAESFYSCIRCGILHQAQTKKIVH